MKEKRGKPQRFCIHIKYRNTHLRRKNRFSSLLLSYIYIYTTLFAETRYSAAELLIAKWPGLGGTSPLDPNNKTVILSRRVKRICPKCDYTTRRERVKNERIWKTSQESSHLLNIQGHTLRDNIPLIWIMNYFDQLWRAKRIALLESTV